MKYVLACLAAATLGLSADAQNCGSPGLEVSVSPQPAQPGEPIRVTLTNNTNQTAWVPCAELFNAVYAGSGCSGATVWSNVCITTQIAPVFPGESFTQTWDQLDDAGQQVPEGVYSVKARYTGGTVGFECCLSFTICSSSAPATSYCTAGQSASGCEVNLGSFGTPSESGSSAFVVQAFGLDSRVNGLFFYGQNGRQSTPWGNGTSYQCVAPPVKRGGMLEATSTPWACGASVTQDLNARWCPSCPRPGHAPLAGQKLQVQLWYRDPWSTSNQTTSLSDALEADVCP